jgi:hypothetical protein
VLARLEYPGGAEEHGHMRVVAARVHLPGVPALVLPLHGLLRPKQKDDESGLHYEQANAYAFRRKICPFWARRRIDLAPACRS